MFTVIRYRATDAASASRLQAGTMYDSTSRNAPRTAAKHRLSSPRYLRWISTAASLARCEYSSALRARRGWRRVGVERVVGVGRLVEGEPLRGEQSADELAALILTCWCGAEQRLRDIPVHGWAPLEGEEGAPRSSATYLYAGRRVGSLGV